MVARCADPTLEAGVRELAEAFVNDQRTFGVTVAIRHGDCDIVVPVGLDGRDPETPQTGAGRILIASVTKTFVAAEMMALARDGKLSLDDTIARWVPQVPNSTNINIGQLLTHTSGLSDDVDTPAWRDALLADVERRYTLDQALDLAAPRADHQPGHYEYVNSNFTIAAIIIEQVTGRSLSDELSSRFFTPLGLDDTSIGDVESIEGLEHGWFTLDDNGWGGTQGERTTFDDSVPRDLDIAHLAGPADAALGHGSAWWDGVDAR